MQNLAPLVGRRAGAAPGGAGVDLAKAAGAVSDGTAARALGQRGSVLGGGGGRGGGEAEGENEGDDGELHGEDWLGFRVWKFWDFLSLLVWMVLDAEVKWEL